MTDYQLAIERNYAFATTVSYVFIVWWTASAAMSIFVINAVLTHNARIALLTPSQRKNLFWGGAAFLTGPILFGFSAVLGIGILEKESAELLMLSGSSLGPPRSFELIKLAVAASTSCFVILLGIWIMLWQPLLRRARGKSL